MKSKFIVFILTIFPALFLQSCEKHEYCAECWERKPLVHLWGPGDVSFCSDDVYAVEEFMYDYEYAGWYCKLKEY